MGQDLTRFFNRQKKRKASIEDPAPAQQKAKKSATKHQLPGGSNGEPSASQATGKPKHKKKTTSKTQPDTHSGEEALDKGEGTSNTMQYVFCFLQYKVINEISSLVSGNPISLRNNPQSTRTIQRLGVRRREVRET